MKASRYIKPSQFVVLNGVEICGVVYRFLGVLRTRTGASQAGPPPTPRLKIYSRWYQLSKDWLESNVPCNLGWWLSDLIHLDHGWGSPKSLC
jgi:hypothetical protein